MGGADLPGDPSDSRLERLKCRLNQKNIMLGACALHGIFTLAVLIYFTLAVAIGIVAMIGVMLIAYISFGVCVMTGKSVFFIPHFVYLIVLVLTHIIGLSIIATILTIRKSYVHLFEIDEGNKYIAELVLLSLNLLFTLIMIYPTYALYRVAKASVEAFSEIANDVAVLRGQSALCNDYAKSPPVNGIQHSGVHRVDAAPVCDDVPVENDSVWERYKRQSLSEANQCDNFHQLYHHCPPVVKNCDPDTGKPYNERAIN